MIEIRALHKRFGAHEVLCGVDLTVGHSEVVCLIGPSGSGKSTLLRCVNFLESYDAGEVRIAGKLIGYEDAPNGARRPMGARNLREMRREIGMVFQHFNLWPHMSALRNVAEPLLRVRGLSASEAEDRARAMLDARRPHRQGRTPTRRACRAASSSASPSPARWRCSRG